MAPWYNEDVKSKKTVLNRAKKLFRNNKTPRNFQQLKDSEEEFELVCEKEKTDWVSITCEKIESCTNPKEKWQEFK